ncbi:hypothetical protein [Alkalibacillus haloalkaliphilus]|uniref:Uncharacterized protein n=1 Tax=Alkalibacillus haloalkaliphilus TaxID=94136 RepID=A0A511W7N7_9BACI|nr:hypothetical protein [Alkalibacillus haloalkaliphilus]GEN47057.1 hypothetical protein AHA02nite_28330 [Alkalibacillus haloalkaliphilus]
MDPIWYFAIASIIAVIGIVIVFGQLSNKLEDQLNQGEVSSDFTQRLTTQLLIRVTIIEIVPILLIVFGFIQLTGTESSVIPLVLTLVVFAVGLIRLLSKRDLLKHSNIDKRTKVFYQSTQKTAMMLAASFPIVTIVAFMM